MSDPRDKMGTSQAGTPEQGPLTGAPGDTPPGQASEVRASSFQVLPSSASSDAREVDAIALTWLVFSLVLILAVFGMLGLFTVRYLRREGREEAVQTIPHRKRNAMEWSWTVALLAASLAMCVWAARTYFRMHLPPRDSDEVFVVAKQWMWKIQHADGTRELDELHVPVGQPIKLIMSSQDVIHSFYLPELRIKQDVLPGRYTYLWFKATRPGLYRIFCAEFCGTSHATMSGKLHVMLPADYLAWKSTQLAGRAGQSESNLASRGRDLFTGHGCVSCHLSNSTTVRAGNGRPGGPSLLAPPLEGLYMKTVGLRTGEQVVADENYLRESILNPSARIVQGYDNIMPSFQGQLSEEDLLALIAYIKSLQHYDRSEP